MQIETVQTFTIRSLMFWVMYYLPHKKYSRIEDELPSVCCNAQGGICLQCTGSGASVRHTLRPQQIAKRLGTVNICLSYSETCNLPVGGCTSATWVAAWVCSALDCLMTGCCSLIVLLVHTRRNMLKIKPFIRYYLRYRKLRSFTVATYKGIQVFLGE